MVSECNRKVVETWKSLKIWLFGYLLFISKRIPPNKLKVNLISLHRIITWGVRLTFAGSLFSSFWRDSKFLKFLRKFIFKHVHLREIKVLNICKRASIFMCARVLLKHKDLRSYVLNLVEVGLQVVVAVRTWITSVRLFRTYRNFGWCRPEPRQSLFFGYFQRFWTPV